MSERSLNPNAAPWTPKTNSLSHVTNTASPGNYQASSSSEYDAGRGGSLLSDDNGRRESKRRTPLDIVRRLNICIVGGIDAGKTALATYLLCGAAEVFDDREIERARRHSGDKSSSSWEFTYLLDITEEERRDRRTHEATRQSFQYCGRNFVLSDSPSPDLSDRTKLTLTEISRSNVVILVVSARTGEFECHMEINQKIALLSSVSGVRHVIVAVNKIDTCGEGCDSDDARLRFEAVEVSIRRNCEKYGFSSKSGNLTVLPISVVKHKNIGCSFPSQIPSSARPASSGGTINWFKGPTLLECLSHLHDQHLSILTESSGNYSSSSPSRIGHENNVADLEPYASTLQGLIPSSLLNYDLLDHCSRFLPQRTVFFVRVRYHDHSVFSVHGSVLSGSLSVGESLQLVGGGSSSSSSLLKIAVNSIDLDGGALTGTETHGVETVFSGEDNVVLHFDRTSGVEESIREGELLLGAPNHQMEEVDGVEGSVRNGGESFPHHFEEEPIASTRPLQRSEFFQAKIQFLIRRSDATGSLNPLVVSGSSFVLHRCGVEQQVSVHKLLAEMDLSSTGSLRLRKSSPQFVMKDALVVARLEVVDTSMIVTEAATPFYGSTLGRFQLFDQGKIVGVGEVTKLYTTTRAALAAKKEQQERH